MVVSLGVYHGLWVRISIMESQKWLHWNLDLQGTQKQFPKRLQTEDEGKSFGYAGSLGRSGQHFSESPSTQYLRFLVPKTILSMVFGTRGLTYWVLGPSLGFCFTRRRILETMACGIPRIEPDCRITSICVAFAWVPNTRFLNPLGS